MTRPALVLRPEPGNADTAARLEAAGLTVIRLPLFEIVALPWTPPVADYDALLLTSANAVRKAGEGLLSYRNLPVVAVGSATAEAAAAAGLSVKAVGETDGVAAVALAHRHGWWRILRLTGKHRTPIDGITDVAVYASEERQMAVGALAAAEGSVALLHSTRAAQYFGALIERAGIARESVRLAAISDKVARAAGAGWGGCAIAELPSDEALIAIARNLAIDR